MAAQLKEDLIAKISAFVEPPPDDDENREMTIDDAVQIQTIFQRAKAESDNGLTVMSTVFTELIKDDYLQRR